MPPASYRRVVRGSAYPAASCTSRSGTPASSAAVTKPCRSECGETRCSSAELGERAKNINDDIAAFVRKGLAPQVQQALDVLRVVGNNAVHPGQIDLRDDRDTALALFRLLNFIVEQQLTRPKELETIYSSLPANALAEI